MDRTGEFDRFVRERAAALMRYGYVLTGNPHDAADLVQEALVRLDAAWARVRRRDDPEGYVRTTMVRLHISRWRRLRREQPLTEAALTEAALTEAALTEAERVYVEPGFAHAEARNALWQALAGLPPRQRAVLVLRYYEHLGDDEIAALLRISRGTVRSQAARALGKLRAEWSPAAANGTGTGGASGGASGGGSAR